MAKATTPQAPPTTDRFERIPFDYLLPAEDNVRDNIGDVSELAASIHRYGLQQPIRVVEHDETHFKIVAGHRRHAAYALLIANGQLPRSVEVAAMVQGTTTDQDRIAQMLIENMHRSDLNPIEEAHAFMRLTTEFGYKQKELAGAVARSTSYISARINLLTLPEQVLAKVADGSFPLEIAGKVARIGDAKAILKLTKQGTVIPQDWQCDNAVNELTKGRVEKDLVAGVEALGLTVHRERGPANDETVLARFTDAKDFDKIPPKIPRSAKAYLIVPSYGSSVAVELRRPMTDNEKAKRQAKAEAESTVIKARYAAEREQRDAEREQRDAELRANQSPQYVDWMETCNTLRAANSEAWAEYRAAKDEAVTTWATSVKAKDVARWVMLDLIASTGHTQLATLFDLQGEDPSEAVIAYGSASAVNLVALCAVTMLHYDLEEASVSMIDFLTLAEIFPPKDLVLPDAPGVENPDGDEELSDGEASAIITELDDYRRATEEADDARAES